MNTMGDYTNGSGLEEIPGLYEEQKNEDPLSLQSESESDYDPDSDSKLSENHTLSESI